jgi:signal transduction histidine kinase
MMDFMLFLFSRLRKPHHYFSAVIQKHSLKRILLASTLASLLLFSIAYTLTLHYFNSASLDQHMGEMWEKQTEHIAKQSKFPIMTGLLEQAQQVVAVFEKNSDVLYFELSSNEKLIYTFGQPSPCFTGHESPLYWCFRAPVKDELSHLTLGYVTLIVSKTKTNNLIQQNLIMNIVLILLLTLLLFLLIYFFLKPVTRTLNDVTDVMIQTQEGRRGLRIDTQGPREIMQIQFAFNQMIDALERHESNLENLVTEKTIALSSAYQSVQAALQVKSDILTIVPHEMKTPLHNATMFLKLFLEKNENQDIDRSFIVTALDAIDKLTDFTHALLNYAKGAAQKISLSPSAFKLPSLIDHLVDEIKPAIENNHNQLSCPSIINLDLYTDKNMIRQILLNLLNNANKFTRNGKITLAITQTTEHIIITVSDTGCGISTEKLSQVFQPFYQVDMSPSRTYEGTGLGLTICKLFAESLKADITVESEFGVGSCFFLTLPASIIQQASSQTSPNSLDSNLPPEPDQDRKIA